MLSQLIFNCTINSPLLSLHLLYFSGFISFFPMSDSVCLSSTSPFTRYKKEQKNNVFEGKVCFCRQDVGKSTRRRISCLFCCTETHSNTMRKKVVRNFSVENKHLSDCWHCDSWRGGGKNERERKREWEMDTAKSALGVSVLAAHLLIDLSIDPTFCLWVFFPWMVLSSMLTMSSPSPSLLSFTFTPHLTSFFHLSIPPSILPHSPRMLCDALQSHTINGKGSWKMICTHLGDFTLVLLANIFIYTTRHFQLLFLCYFKYFFMLCHI